MNREGDPASVPPNAFRMLINVRVDDSEIKCRGGQTSMNPNDTLDGCVTGVFPPEFEPPDAAFNRLFIAEQSSGGLDDPETHLFCPNENEEVTSFSAGDGFGAQVDGLYWSGDRLLAIRNPTDDGAHGVVDEYRAETSSGVTDLIVAEPPAGIDLEWEGSVGGVVIAQGTYYVSRSFADVDPAEEKRVEKVQFGATDFEFANELAEDFADYTASFITAAVDGRVYWFGKNSATAALRVRSPATGSWSTVSFPSGFFPFESFHANAWHAAKLYIAGLNGTDLVICAYDPVANTISAARTISGTSVDHCPMAAHKGVLYFAYGLSGGAERVGMLRKGVWSNSIAAFSAPADIYDLCSFQDHLYMTKGTFLLRCSDPSANPTFETFFEAIVSGLDLGAMVAVP